MSHALETSRTIMRPFAIGDAAAAFSWFSDPAVMRYIPSGPDPRIEDTQARIQRYMDHQNSHGFSKWVIVDRDTQGLIGDAGFFFLPDNQRVELGYRLCRPFWRGWRWCQGFLALTANCP